MDAWTNVSSWSCIYPIAVWMTKRLRAHPCLKLYLHTHNNIIFSKVPIFVHYWIVICFHKSIILLFYIHCGDYCMSQTARGHTNHFTCYDKWQMPFPCYAASLSVVLWPIFCCMPNVWQIGISESFWQLVSTERKKTTQNKQSTRPPLQQNEFNLCCSASGLAWCSTEHDWQFLLVEKHRRIFPALSLKSQSHFMGHWNYFFFSPLVMALIHFKSTVL